MWTNLTAKLRRPVSIWAHDVLTSKIGGYGYFIHYSFSLERFAVIFERFDRFLNLFDSLCIIRCFRTYQIFKTFSRSVLDKKAREHLEETWEKWDKMSVESITPTYEKYVTKSAWEAHVAHVTWADLATWADLVYRCPWVNLFYGYGKTCYPSP